MARDLWKNSGGNLKELSIVFPNLRAGWMFKRELQKLADKPVWSPQIESIDNWIIGISGWHKTDSLTQLLLLYPEVRKHLPYLDSFAGFMDLGEMILTDFDDVDKYLIHPERIFQALKELRKIDETYGLTGEDEVLERISRFWRSFSVAPSAHQKNWLAVWEKLSPVYQGFQQSLLKKGLATSGMCYRHAANLVSSGKADLDNRPMTVFVGFNILTRAEELIFTSLKNEGKALFYWDYHPFYMEGNHEAGRFISHYLTSYPPPDTFIPWDSAEPDLLTNRPDQTNRIRVVPVTSDTGQVYSLVSDLASSRQGSTAIVLPDESLLSELIIAWPLQAGKVNFTSGYPLGATQAATFIRAFIDACDGFLSSSPDFSPDTGLTAALTDHPWCSFLAGQEDPVRVATEWVSVCLTPEKFAAQLDFLINQLILIPELVVPLEKTALERIRDFLQEVHRSFLKSGIDQEFNALARILKKFLLLSRITLETDKDAINQVLGVLETRLLDFDHVYVLSFNEGIWPSKALSGSLIPYSLRRYFRLPTAESRDSMHSYYFYRLIQRASDVTLFYLTGHMDDNYRSGEVSRYVTQLLFDSAVRVDHLTEPPLVISADNAGIVIEKDGEVWTSLQRYQDATSGKCLSASAINDYLDCPLRFALRYLCDLKEPDEQVVASEPKNFGKLLHLVLENIYKPFVGAGAGPTSEWYRKLLGDRAGLTDRILSAYHSMLKDEGAVMPTGKDELAIGVALEFITETLRIDSQQPPSRILNLESQFYKRIGTVNTKAVVDRIDLLGGRMRIVDYKTGSCELDFSLMSDVFETKNQKRKKEIFQVLFYAELLSDQQGYSGELAPALYRFIRFKAGTEVTQVTYNKQPLCYSTVRSEYVERLRLVLAEIFDQGTPFIQTGITGICRNCSFSGLCRRV